MWSHLGLGICCDIFGCLVSKKLLMKLGIAEFRFLGVILIKVYMTILLNTDLKLGKNPQSFFKPTHLVNIAA